MSKDAGNLFSQEEIERACGLLEDFFGRDYFKDGVELLKDSDPSGSGMGREHGGSGVARLQAAWHKAMEELAFANLQGYFRPGKHSTLIGIIGSSLAALSGSPGLEQAASGLLADPAFRRTRFLLQTAASFSSTGATVIFQSDRKNIFTASPGNVIHCLRAQNHLSPPFSPQELRKPILERLETESPWHEAGHKRLIYIDLTGPWPPVQEVGQLLQEEPAAVFSRSVPGTAAVVLCQLLFWPGLAGVRWRLDSHTLINQP